MKVRTLLAGACGGVLLLAGVADAAGPTQPYADLSVVTSVSAAPGAGGGSTGLTEIITDTITNYGPNPAQRFTLSDQTGIPTNSTVTVHTTTSGCFASGSTITCTLPGTASLAVGASVKVTINVTGWYAPTTNTATVTPTTPDAMTSNNSSTAVFVPGMPSTLVPTGPSVALAASAVVQPAADQNAVQAGDTITYHYKVTNSGQTALSGVSVTDSFGTVTCPQPGLTGLAAGATIECLRTHVVTAADAAGPEIDDTATATGTTAALLTSPKTPPANLTVYTALPAA